MQDICDIYNNDLNKNDKILSLGCGISNHNTVSEVTVNNCFIQLYQYPNLFLSDIDLNDELILNENDFIQCKINDQYFNITYDMLKNRFFVFNLLNDDFSKLDLFNFIEVRNVLHFNVFKNKRINIINNLYDKLLPNGKLAIQCYTSINADKINNIDEYLVLSLDEINELQNIYKDNIKTIVNIDNNNGQHCIIIINK